MPEKKVEIGTPKKGEAKQEKKSEKEEPILKDDQKVQEKPGLEKPQIP